MVQWPAPVMKRKKKGSWWCKIGGREGRIDGGESRSESQSPESLLSCRRHYLMKPRGGFSWGNVCVRREGEACWNRQRETRKELLQVCRGGKKLLLMVAAWARCHQALRNRDDRFFCRKKKKKRKMFHWSCMPLPAFQSLPSLPQHLDKLKTTVVKIFCLGFLLRGMTATGDPEKF